MKILIVDDSAMIRTRIRQLLESKGYEALEAEDGAVALQKVIANKNCLDLITLDVEMPKMDGFKTCKVLHTEKYKEIFTSRTGKPTPVVFVTGNDNLDDRIKGFELGATDFISKEALESSLLPTVEKILNPSKLLEGLKALVVEDSKMHQKIITDTLERQGVEADKAGDGIEAFEIMKKDPEKYDMIIIDLSMPKMDGLTLTRKIRNELRVKKIPIFMLSATSDKTTQVELFNAGASDYIVKPFIQEELLARLKVHLENIWYNRKLKEQLEELKESREALIVSNNERKELLHVLCHDLSNPLGAIVGILELLELEGEFKEFANLMLKAANNGLEIIDLVRKLRALEEDLLSREMVEMNLSQAIEESVVILYQRFTEKEIQPQIQVDKALSVIVEPVSFKNSVLNNILTNAIKFSFKNSQILISAEPQDENVKLIVRDYGIGMSKQLLEHLFDINKATSRVGTEGESGTGFGMPLVRKFIQSYSGRIEIDSWEEKESPENHGTEVRILLPSATAN